MSYPSMRKIGPSFCCESDVRLSERTTLGIGGVVEKVVSVFDARGVEQVLNEFGPPRGIFGGGSNTLAHDIQDAGYLMSASGRRFYFSEGTENVEVWAEAGVSWDFLVEKTVEYGVHHLANLSGIPGWVGAAPFQNIGAYGVEISEFISWVRAYDFERGKVVTLSAAECEFSYRNSVFKVQAKRFLILGIHLSFARGQKPNLSYRDLKALADFSALSPKALRDHVLSIRREKSMVFDTKDLNSHSAGSFFLNPIVSAKKGKEFVAKYPSCSVFLMRDGRIKIPAGWLVESAGFSKGHIQGRVGLSSKHALAIINRGGASSEEALSFVATLQAAVRKRFSIELEQEPRII